MSPRTRWAVRCGATIGLCVATALDLQAQTTDALARRGIHAYRVLEYDLAVELLRQGLDARDAGLSASARAELALYLGAAEFHRGNVARADLAFREALAAAPGVRPDTLVFPPRVVEAFEAARARTAFVALVGSKDTTIAVQSESLRLRLHASAPHALEVAVCDVDGDAREVLYEGQIADSLKLHWSGLDADGRLPPPDRTAICIRSRDASGSVVESVHPVRVTPVTGALTARPSGALASLAVAAFAAFLPDLVGSAAPTGGARFGLSGAVLVAGMLRPKMARRGQSADEAQSVALDASVTHLRISVTERAAVSERAP